MGRDKPMVRDDQTRLTDFTPDPQTSLFDWEPEWKADEREIDRIIDELEKGLVKDQ